VLACPKFEEASWCRGCRFTEEESVSSQGQVKSSVQRGIRAKILELYPLLEGVLDDILPKKSNITLVRW
jgi:malignant T-cell-amplified sequence